MVRKLVAVVVAGAMVTGCATWSASEVKNAPEGAAPRQAETQARDILITENDITDRKYTGLGDISVTVNKTTIFHSDPTLEMVSAKLKEEAAKLGADAVIFVRYGTVGISMLSWGSLDGKGRAIKFAR
jgi:hypothetical protein